MLRFKLSMLCEELSTFFEVQKNIVKFEGLLVEDLMSRDRLNERRLKVETGSKRFFGLLQRTSREDQLAELEIQSRELEERIEVTERLLKLAYNNVLRCEIPLLKLQRRNRQSSFLHEFSCQRVEKVKGEMEFWKGVRNCTKELAD